MKSTMSIAAMMMLAGIATGEPLETPPAPEGVDQAQHERAFRMIQMQTFYSLPEAHRAEIIAAAEERGIDLPMTADDLTPETDPGVIERSKPLTDEEAEQAFAKVSETIDLDRESFDGFSPIHQRMLASFAEVAKQHEVPVMPCFTPGTSQAVIDAFEAIVFATNPMAFQQTSRWQSTALNPGSAAQGDPTILTYSFPADGVTVPNGVGEGTGPNNLNSWLDGIYGNRATWRALYDEIFAGWGEISGNTYVLEPNDDNVTLFNSPGVAGVRGDLRMAAKTIDGNSGILAYNFFPQNGDMVLDSADNFYNNTTNNSLRLRNILYHEHGHGMGQLHVCPLSNEMLMNPFINLGFDGPQFDDTLNAQRHYGDFLEPNDSTGAASPLGSLNPGDSANVGGTIETGIANKDNVDWVSVDDNNDRDFYAFTLSQDGLVTATATPLGYTYLDNTQTNQCNTGTNYDTLRFGDIRVRVYNSGGTLIGSADANGFGDAETIIENLDAGNYFIEVDTSSTTNDEIQAYVLDIDVEQSVPQPLELAVGTIPAFVPPALPGFFDVTIDLNDDTITDGPDLVVTNPGGTSTVPLIDNGGGSYTAQIPAQDCGDDPDFFVTVTGSLAGTVNSATFGTVIGVETIIAADSGDNVIGLSVGGTITQQSAGQWTAGAPEGNDRDDPAVDFDGNGLCWLTGRTPGNTNSDVDGGFTTLETVDYDFSNGGFIRYAYWAADSVNTLDEATDGLFFEYSVNGGSSWITLRDYDTANEWFTDSVSAAEVGSAASVRFRWRAQEAGAGDVFEAAVDAIEVGTIECDGGPTCDNPADTNGDGEVSPADFNAWVAAFNSQAPECDQNGDGLCTPADFNAWVANFNIGCP